MSCGTIICIAAAGDIGVVMPIVTGTKAATRCLVRAAAVVSAPVSFLEKETGVGCRICTEDKLASITLGVTACLNWKRARMGWDHHCRA